MPNRILKETWRTSATINALSDGAETLAARLITVADDFGRFEADPLIVLSQAYPLKVKELSVEEIESRLQELVSARGFLQLYEVDGKRYGCFPRFAKSNGRRAKNSKFPGPDDPSASTCTQMQADASTCEQLPRIRDTRHETRDTRGKASPSCSEPFAGSEPPPDSDPPVLEFPVSRKGQTWALRESLAGELRGAYPGVDFDRELQAARAWCVTNPTKRKTDRGMPAFLNRWLGKAQDQPRRGPPNGRQEANEPKGYAGLREWYQGGTNGNTAGNRRSDEAPSRRIPHVPAQEPDG